MELPRRSRGDELLRPGELTALRHRLRRVAPRHDLVTVIACAFDHRTRMLPFIFADTRMAPAGVRAIGSALADAGFAKTRIVLQQWNRRFRPSRMRLDGRVPDLFMVSSMGLHSDECMRLIRDARRIEPAHRPLVIAGGPHAVYQPHELFGVDPADPTGADVVVTGEEFVLLSLLEALLSTRSPGESMRAAFLRARDAGALDGIPGLIYARGARDGVAEELVDTGVQRLLGDLDELPDPVLGYRLLEAPSRWGGTLASQALPAGRVRKLSPISSIVLTFGCKFACPYCPIPAYNQRQHRVKSGQRIAEEMYGLYRAYGLRYFFGADDNFFNNKARTLDIVQTLARAEFDGVALRRKARWHTEVTVHDTLQMKEHLPLVRESGCRALWLGVEDMTATLVNKGQSVNKTTEAFRSLRDAGICPMPMMMHHDTQPLYSRGTNYGLLNQIKILRKAGAVSLQVLMMTPSAGTKLYEDAFTSGMVIDRAGGRPAAPHMYDGNHVVASAHARPWRKQLNMLLGYLYFYNVVWLLVNAWRRKTPVSMRPAYMQVIGILGLFPTAARTAGWALRLMFGGIERRTSPPACPVPMRSPSGVAPASHATCETPARGPTPRSRAVSLTVTG
ncbi:MAG: Mg-protoporphyrin IX monomethyl ester oxidative cyclase (anaerobic) [uncultured Phycisphaerae bacterium]|uniref:Mg-protoporphyrin IX monomethyl ester oxidative cyclase (Anaerobic) n=1 Tax=uncultured Phycisphaerae bacterium TaxID=904963 RepID=A0A6J4QN92_9BACT|nr:MAG: Mg-protoporphyrin IX monomethyl ester oxidative cyclase (anaerobic) [uncultured Phycisphaerae bacterium]